MIKKQKLIVLAATAVVAVFLFSSCKNGYILTEKPEQETKTDLVTGISLKSGESTISLVNGSNKKIEANVIPGSASNKKLTYSINKEDIAAVTADGTITAKKTGNAVITIQAAGNTNVSKTVNLVVTEAPVPVESIEFDAALLNKPLELVIGTDYELQPKVMPENATNKTLEITSSNTATALPNGVGNRWIQAKQEGTATITVKSVDNPEAKQELTVIVKKPPEIRIQNVSLLCGSSGGDTAITVQTLYGKRAYTLEITGGGSKWVSNVEKESKTDDTDIVRLTVTENKTIWERATSIKFKDTNGTYLKDAHSQKDLEVKLTQAKNENPNVRIEWVHGITAPTSGEKKRIGIAGSNATDYHKMPHIFMWEETPTTTFFNTRKVTHTNAQNEGYPDGKHCWAKTNANMLHWWFTQNAQYIKSYREKNPERIAKKAKELEAVVPAFYNKTDVDKSELKLYEPFYRRGLSNEEEHKKSSIANIYRRNFTNYGNNIGIGLKWYLVGHSGFAKNKKYSPALFDDVFDQGNALSEDDTALITSKGLATKKEFEEILKDALKSKKAVALNKWGTDRSQHAITLWGAAFDEDDNILAVYVVDNNDHENKIFPYGIWYQKGIDIYAEPQLDENNKARFNPYLIDYISNVYDSKHYIGEITTLATGEAQWQAWLKAHPNAQSQP